MIEYPICITCGGTRFNTLGICTHCGRKATLHGYEQNISSFSSEKRVVATKENTFNDTKFSELNYIPRFRIRGKLF